MARKRNEGYAYVDEHVGERIRVHRTLLGMSQEKLGEVLGLSFQQVQKYEKGANRVSASRLVQFSKILNVPVSYFFDNLPADPNSVADVLVNVRVRVLLVPFTGHLAILRLGGSASWPATSHFRAVTRRRRFRRRTATAVSRRPQT